RGRRPQFQLVYPLGDETISAAVELMRTQLAKTGIDMESKGYTTTLFISEILPKGNWDMALFNWTLDPSAGLSDTYACASAAPNGSNYGRYCSRTMDDLLERYTATYDV